MTSKHPLPVVLPWFLIVLIGLLAAWLRYGFIEPPALAHLCEDGLPPAWCGVRQLIVIGFNSYGYGITAIIVTALALIMKKPWIAWLAAVLGVFALIMYCFYAGAVALLVGCLRLLRLQANRMNTPGHQHGHGNRQIHSQP